MAEVGQRRAIGIADGRPRRNLDPLDEPGGLLDLLGWGRRK